MTPVDGGSSGGMCFTILLSNRLNELFIHTARENLRTTTLYERNQTKKSKHLIILEDVNDSIIKEKKSMVPDVVKLEKERKRL